MLPRLYSLILVIALALILLPLYGRRSRDAADFTFVNKNQINTLDPQQVSWSSDIRICLNVWEGLTTHDPNTLEPIAGMAEDWSIYEDDPRVYTFRLRSDSHWSNGDPVTSEDFIRGWRRALEPGTAADYAFLLTDYIDGALEYQQWRNEAVGILTRLEDASELSYAELPVDLLGRSSGGDYSDVEHPGPEELALLREAFLREHAEQMDARWEKVGVRALDPQTLKVTLTRPTSYFLELLAMPVFMPIHETIELLHEQVENGRTDRNGLVTYDSEWTKPDYHLSGYPGLVSNGPYRLHEWQFRHRLRLACNRHHYRYRQIRLPVLDLLMFEDPNTAFLAYENGQVDWMTVLDVPYVDELLQLQYQGVRDDIHNHPAFGTYFYNFNCRDPALENGQKNPFVDRRVREAFTRCIDRKLFCENVALKGNPPAWTLIPPGTIAGYPIQDGAGYDPVRSNELLDEAGYKDRSVFPPVSILCDSSFEHQRYAEAVAHMWEHALGVRVQLENQESRVFIQRKRKHQFQVARGGWYGDYMDPTTFLDVFLTGNGNNDSAYSNPRYDALLGKAAEISDPHARLRVLAQAESLLVTQDFPIAPVFQYTNPQAFRSSVRGIGTFMREIYPWHAIWVDR